MSKAHQYHQPNAPDSPVGDEDSDDELDLGELDAFESTHGSLPRTVQDSRTRPTDLQGGGQIPLRNLRTAGFRGFGRRYRAVNRSSGNTNPQEDLQGLLQDDVDVDNSVGGINNPEDATSLLHHDRSEVSGGYGAEARRRRLPSRIRFPSFISGRSSNTTAESPPWDAQDESAMHGSTRNISIGQYPPPRFPPNAVSNAKYTPWSFLPRTLYNEFSFFINLYFLFVALSQIIPDLRIGYLPTYIAPLAFVLFITLGKEALDDIARRRRDAESNKEPYSVLRLRDATKSSQMNGKSGKRRERASLKAERRARSASQGRLNAIEEEEENVGESPSHESSFEIDEIEVKSRDLKVGDIVKLGKDQRVPADLVILKCFTTESTVVTPSRESAGVVTAAAPEMFVEPELDSAISETASTPGIPKQSPSVDDVGQSSDHKGAGETFIRTDQLDGETDWKLRLASPLTQSLDLQDFTRITIIAGKPERKVNEFVGTLELSPSSKSMTERRNTGFAGQPQKQDQKVVTAPLTIDNTAWANTVLASSATVLAVVLYTGPQTRQALSTSASRSKTGLLEYEINNLTKILCALTLTLSIVLVGFEGFDKSEDEAWYISILRFLILFSTIIPISLRVNLDMGKSVYAWFIEKDQGMPGAVVRTSTIPEDLGRIEYLLSDKTGTLTQNGKLLRRCIYINTDTF